MLICTLVFTATDRRVLQGCLWSMLPYVPLSSSFGIVFPLWERSAYSLSRQRYFYQKPFKFWTSNYPVTLLISISLRLKASLLGATGNHEAPFLQVPSYSCANKSKDCVSLCFYLKPPAAQGGFYLCTYCTYLLILTDTWQDINCSYVITKCKGKKPLIIPLLINETNTYTTVLFYISANCL